MKKKISKIELYDKFDEVSSPKDILYNITEVTKELARYKTLLNIWLAAKQNGVPINGEIANHFYWNKGSLNAMAKSEHPSERKLGEDCLKFREFFDKFYKQEILYKKKEKDDAKRKKYNVTIEYWTTEYSAASNKKISLTVKAKNKKEALAKVKTQLFSKMAKTIK